MSQQILKKKEERAKLVSQAREILDLAEKENRALTSEEEVRQDALFNDADKLTSEIDRLERMEKVEIEARAKSQAVAETAAIESRGESTITPELRAGAQRVFKRFLADGPRGLSQEDVDVMKRYNIAVENRTMAAFNAGQSEMLTPQEFSTKLIEDVTKKVAVRRLAQSITLTTLAGFHAPTLAEDTEESDATGELTAPSSASDIEFGSRELRPHQFTKKILLPIALLQSSPFDIEGLAVKQLGSKRARKEESMFCNGSGTGEALGLFTASNFGIPTSRDTVCGDSSDFTWDGMIDVIAALREEYQVGAKFLLARNAWARLRKLKDGEGRYVWQPSVLSGQPNTILDYPYEFSDYVPSTYTTGKYVGIFGNFDWYWIVDFAFNYLQRLDELYAETNQVALINRFWTDGAPVQPAAFVRMKLG